MNSLTIAGNIGRDAELRQMPDGTPVAQFSVADSQGREKPTIWWRCQIFGKRAESLSQYLLKGQPVTVSGNVTEREWTDKDGIARKSMELRVSDVALQGGKRDAAAPSAESAAKPKAATTGSGFDDLDDDIPW